VVVVDGTAALYLERGGRSLFSLPAATEAVHRRAVDALASLVVAGGPLRELRVERVDRGPVGDAPLAAHLLEAGFRPSYRGYVLRRP
jgi:ATP-dependent helicase Lhr and Lhr-like helicase